MSTTLEQLIAEPLIETSNPHLNGILTITLFLLTITAIINVVRTLQDVSYTSNRWYDRSSAGVAKRRQIYFFLGLAVVSFILVNGLRFEHRKLISGPWRDLAESMQDLQKSVVKKARWQAKGLEEMPNGIPGRAYRPNVHFEDLFPSRATIRKWKESALGAEEAAIEYIRDQLPFFEHDWLRSASIWDHFKMLVGRPARFWWLQQWFTGYLAFGLFVGVRYYHHHLPTSATVSFIFLAYIAGLTSMQCLFFAYLILRDNRNLASVTHSWILKPIVVIPLLAASAFELVSLPTLLEDSFKETGFLVFNVCQMFLIMQPIVLPILIWYPDIIRFRRWPHEFRLRFSYTWFLTSIVALGLHWWSTFEVLSSTDQYSGRFWNHLPFSSGSRSQIEHHGDIVKHTWLSVFGALGDSHYINALGLDVLLSALALGCWAVAGELDPRSMIKNSIWPLIREGDRLKPEHRRIRDQRHSPADDSDDGADDPTYVASTGMGTRRRSSAHRARRVDPYEEDEPQPAKRRGRPPKGGARSRSTSKARDASASPRRARSQSTGRSNVSTAKRASSTSRRSLRPRQRAVEPRIGAVRVWWERWMPAIQASAEAVGAACALFLFGGLGMASAGVFGAEELL